jgi:protein gp37
MFYSSPTLEGLDMANATTIEWTDATWNPVTGCTKISNGCDNCYAER